MSDHGGAPAAIRPPNVRQSGAAVDGTRSVVFDIREMEKRPFEGIIFRTKGFDHVFDVRPWNKADLQPQLDTLSQIQWQKFTDNFLTLYAANRWKMDWFNDDQWKIIAENLRLFSRAVRYGKCVGVCFDPEPYGDNPWAYPGQFKDKSFDQAADKVRQRGRQFIVALQEGRSQRVKAEKNHGDAQQREHTQSIQARMLAQTHKPNHKSDPHKGDRRKCSPPPERVHTFAHGEEEEGKRNFSQGGQAETPTGRLWDGSALRRESQPIHEQDNELSY